MTRKPPAPSEEQLHRSVALFLAKALNPPTTWSTIGHGGGGKARGAKLKAMGLRAGWPDIIVLHPLPVVGSTMVIGIELKRVGGSQSAEQRAVERAFRECRAGYYVCRSIGDVEFALRDCGLTLHATVLTAAMWRSYDDKRAG